jgi:hypothetical protein
VSDGGISSSGVHELLRILCKRKKFCHKPHANFVRVILKITFKECDLTDFNLLLYPRVAMVPTGYYDVIVNAGMEALLVMSVSCTVLFST